MKWTREHLLIALNLYCKIPFGSFDRNNPVVKEVAAKMGRTSNSLAMKLSNFASLDPVQRKRGIKGLAGASNQDRQMWHEFHAHPATLGADSEKLLHHLFTNDETKELDFLTPGKVRLTAPTESQATVKIRRGQQFFRQSILNEPTGAFVPVFSSPYVISIVDIVIANTQNARRVRFFAHPRFGENARWHP